ncbi:MAG: LysR family transcriptional regulator [Pseudooceanicola sp.]
MSRHFDWDDLRVILSVARLGSVRAGAADLGLHHSSVVRRIAAFESRHGIKVFDRQATGYVATATGEDILAVAEQIEADALALERRVIGRDAELRGQLRLTLPIALATHLLMPDITAFSRDHPGISLEIDASAALSDLTRRDADVAIRVTKGSPPEHLIGRRAGRVAFARYRGTGGDDQLGWTRDARFHQFNLGPAAPPRLAVSDVLLQLAACRAGYGEALLPRFIGDAEPDLDRRGPPRDSPEVSVWVLTHADLARTARIRAFTDFMFHALRSHRSRLDPD